MEAYGGMQAQSGGVLGMLQVIESDFSRVVADTTAAEAQAVAEYKEFMSTSETDKVTKHKTAEQLKLDKDQQEFEREQIEKDLAETEKGLEAANAYYDTLKPECVTVRVSFEERVSKRKEEIAALK